MKNLPSSLSLKDSEYLSILASIEQAVVKIWKVPLHQYFTNHDVYHSEKIITLVGNLLDSLENKLTEIERFILLAAIYLHDIGMQSPIHAGLEKKNEYSFEELEKIRSVHNTSSEKMIFESLTSNQGLELGLRGCNAAILKLIATVAKCHRKCDLTKLNETVIGSETVRLPLLASLLRLGDELDIDYERITIEKLLLININTISKFHWWSHLYVQGIKVFNGRVTIFFCFPEKYRDSDYTNSIKDKSKNAIQATINSLSEIFYDYALNLFHKVDEVIDYSETQHLLPDDLIEFLDQNQKESNVPQISQSKRKKINFVYNFIPPGSVVSENAIDERKKIKKNRIILDVGNKFELGIIDTHILSNGVNSLRSTAGGIISCPNFILENITEDATEVEVITHSSPDFDCFASVYLIEELILKNSLPEHYKELVDYVEIVDSGRAKIEPGYFYTPNIIARAISPSLESENPNLKDYLIEVETMRRGVSLINYCMNRLNQLIANKNLSNWSLLSVGSPFDKEHNYLLDDLNKYRRDVYSDSTFINEKGTRIPLTEKIEIALPKIDDNSKKQFVNGILWNNIPSCILHKDWARVDEKAPGGNGFVFTFIPTSYRTEITEQKIMLNLNRVIISVKPESAVCLKGLGEKLEYYEIKKENQLLGENVNIWRSRDIVRKSIDYATNEDPWYDGKGHAFTIIDSPGKYSLLSIDEIKQVLKDYTEFKIVVQ